MVGKRSLGSTLGVLALAGAAFMLGNHCALRAPGGSPGPRVSAALAEPDSIARAAALVPTLRALDAADLGEVEAAYRDAYESGAPSGSAIVLLSETWAELDPTGALDRVSTWPGAARAAAQTALMRAWGRRNRTAALQWAAGSGDDGALGLAALESWAQSDDPAIWDHVAELDPSQREAAATAMMQAVITREGFDGLLTRVAAVDDASYNGFKVLAIATATGLVADHEPVRALAFADRYAGTPFEPGLLQKVAVRWVMRDGQAALQMLADRPQSEERDTALREAYYTWLRREHAAAMAWMPESAAQDPRFVPLVDIYAVAIANNEPDDRPGALRKAIRWAEGIPDPAKRKETFVRLGVLWLYYEPDAAAPWLVQQGIDAEVREQLAFYERVGRKLSGAK